MSGLKAPWKKGQSGNPSGKPKQLLTRDKVYAIIGKFAYLTREQLQSLVQDAKTPMIEIMVASIMVKAAKDGDYARMSFLLDRTIGKPPAHEDDLNSGDSTGMSIEEKIEWLKSRQKNAS